MDYSSAMNWLDIIILGVILFYLYEGFAVGFVVSCLDLLSFSGSYVGGLYVYSLLGGFLMGFFPLSPIFANGIGFFIGALIIQIILGFILHKVVGVYFERFTTTVEQNIQVNVINKPLAFTISFNKLFGIIPGVLSAYIILSFLLTVIVALPLSSFLKNSISASRLGNGMILGAQHVEKTMQKLFGNASSESLSFLTIKPSDNEFVSLEFRTTLVFQNTKAEDELLTLVNSERVKNDLKPFIFDQKLTVVARSHASDMLEKGYLSQNTPDNVTLFDRMVNGNVVFATAGENSALAPNVAVVMQGFMQSEEHKKNILSHEFGKIGIGAIDGGKYGIMFVQEFTD